MSKTLAQQRFGRDENDPILDVDDDLLKQFAKKKDRDRDRDKDHEHGERDREGNNDDDGGNKTHGGENKDILTSASTAIHGFHRQKHASDHTRDGGASRIQFKKPKPKLEPRISQDDDHDDDNNNRSTTHRRTTHKHGDKVAPKVASRSGMKKMNWDWLLHPLMIAVYTMVVVFLLLCIFQPIFVTSPVKHVANKSGAPMTHAERTMLSRRRKLSLLKATLWALVAGAVVAVIPYIVAMINKAKNNNK